MDATRACPYCAEEIPAAAVRCRYCRSRVTTLDPGQWHRDHPERRLAGVSAAIARPLAVPLPMVRLGFIVLTLVHLVGPVLYAALWLLIPFASGEPSLLERGLGRVRALAAQLGGHDPAARGPVP